MANKYYYVILNKENGKPFLDCGRLPIFYSPTVAKENLSDFDKSTTSKYGVFKIPVNSLDALFLKSKP